MIRRRPLPRQLAVARHGDNEERQQMGAEIEEQIVGIAERQQRHDAGDRKRLGDQHPAMRHERTRLEDEHEGQEVERKRNDPQQRRRGDVGRDVSGYRHQHSRRNRGQECPAAKRAPGRRRRCQRVVARDHSGARRRAQQQHAARRDQREQQPISAAPQSDVLAQRQRRLENERVGQQRQEAADIRGRVEEVRVLAGRMSGAHEPGLQQRIIGSERKNGSPIETANSPISQSAAQVPGGSPKPCAIDNGSVSPAATRSAIRIATATAGRTVRIST